MSIIVTGDALVATISRDMQRLPEATRKAVRPRLRESGQTIADDAKTRASWSTRIPATIRVTASFRPNFEGVTIRAGGRSAPHARPYENFGGRGQFRHPLFGDRKRWYTQAARPFLAPAAEAGEKRAALAVRAALDDAARDLGFGGT